MPGAAKWGDVVAGVCFHAVMVPGQPSPVVLPHVYLGAIIDPLGLMLSCALGAGPVLINGRPAVTAATGVKILVPHRPTPPGVSFAPNDTACGTGIVISGSQTVTFGGMSASRSGSIVSTCGFPVNAPGSTVIAVPAGAPVTIGGPEAVNATAAVLAGIRTKWVSDKMHNFFRIAPRTRISKAICFMTGHPVDVMTGEVLFTRTTGFSGSGSPTGASPLTTSSTRAAPNGARRTATCSRRERLHAHLLGWHAVRSRAGGRPLCPRARERPIR